MKRSFVCAQVQYLGYIVGRGKICHPDSKLESLKNFKSSQNRRELRRFLGCIGYYRRFLRNFSITVATLTELLKKEKYVCSEECE